MPPQAQDLLRQLEGKLRLQFLTSTDAKTALENKDEKGLTWPAVGEAIGRGPVYAAMLVYGYGQATEEEADGLVKVLGLPGEAKGVLTKRLRANPKAWEFWQSEPPGRKRTACFWVMEAKKPETRERRFQTLLANSTRGVPMGILVPKSKR